MMRNILYYGDNLDILRRYIDDESVDLIYLDPPFNSNQTYNVLFAEQNGTQSASQIKAFDDTWTYDEEAARAYEQVLTGPEGASRVIRAFRDFLGTSNMMAYLANMAVRLVELRRVLKSTGSLYLHCDSTASHYLKILLDAIYAPTNFQNEIVWKRTSSHNDPKRFGRISDRILFYSKGPDKNFTRPTSGYSQEQLSRYKYQDDRGFFRAENLTAPHFSPTRTVEWRGTHPGSNRQWRFSIEELERLFLEDRILLRGDGSPRKDGLKEYLDDAEGQPLQDIWPDIVMGPTAGERLGYPTQKPEALLERIISASSNEGDVVLDPFCGCGTAVIVAHRLKRRWIGVDITHLAINLIRTRLIDSFGERVDFEVVGEPVTLPDAEVLARQDPWQFQWWALGLAGARPAEQKKGADKGIDGRLFFHDEGHERTKQIIISVKAGKTGVSHVRDLRGVLDREKAQIGVLITLQEPTRKMREEAASGGFYEKAAVGHSRELQFPRMQILTISELLEGKGIEYPHFGYSNATFKKAKKSDIEEGRKLRQKTLDEVE